MTEQPRKDYEKNRKKHKYKIKHDSKIKNNEKRTQQFTQKDTGLRVDFSIVYIYYNYYIILYYIILYYIIYTFGKIYL